MTGAEIRYNYVIGDVQGCFEALKALLKTIQFDPDQDFIWFAGDLVARGENSLGALRFIKKLVERNAAATVLGNHDLTLLAAARGIKAIKDKDNIGDVIDAIDSDDLIDWLRKQPLCLFPNATTVLTHAGIPTNWTAEQTAALAAEVEAVIAADDFDVVDAFLKEMYGKEPTLWSDELTGHARLRCIVNYLTRMRLTDQCWAVWILVLKTHSVTLCLKASNHGLNLLHEQRKPIKLCLGHWAALQGKTIFGLDSKCRWRLCLGASINGLPFRR